MTILKYLRKADAEVRWGELEEGLKPMSTATLSAGLKEFCSPEIGLVMRIVDNKKYPPAVYYQITSKGKMTENLPSPFREQFEIDSMYEAKSELVDPIMVSSIGDLAKDAEETIFQFIKSYSLDWLSTMVYCLEKPEETSAFLIWYHKEAYGMMLEKLIRRIKTNTLLKEAIIRLYNEAKKEWEQQFEERLDTHFKYFNDKELIKAIMRLYYAERSTMDIKAFISSILGNKKLQYELAQITNKPVEPSRIEKILLDPGWSTVKITYPFGEQKS